MYRFFLLSIGLFATLIHTPALAQKHFQENQLAISWKLLSNRSEGAANAMNGLTIRNKGKVNFPATGWTLFFSSSRPVLNSLPEGGIGFAHVNGDMYKCFPLKEFKGLRYGQSVSIKYITEGLTLNPSASPSGWYIVWDKTPEKGLAIKDIETEPIEDSIESYRTVADLYHSNAATEDIPLEQLPPVFPTPVSFTKGEGVFEINKDIAIICGEEFANESAYLANALKSLTGARPAIASAFIQAVRSIQFLKQTMNSEAYRLDVKPDGIRIFASSGAGFFYGIQSLLSLVPPGRWSAFTGTVLIPAATVIDSPRFGFRSLHVDIARNFQPKTELLRMIDLMATYKLNALHLHFSDDEGWRIEIPSLPELTTLGAQRGHTTDSKKNLPASYGAGPVTGLMPASGFYTRNDFMEILRYAKARHIQVIPEIESPGHSRAAIKSMDARYDKLLSLGKKTEAEQYLLRDLKDESVYSSAQNWNDNVMCVALPSVYNFIERVVDDLRSMYQEAGAELTTIHLGGDEVPEGTWEKSPACQELIAKDAALQETNDLWYYYYTKLNKLLQERNLTLSGWEEVGMRKTTVKGKKKLIVNPELSNQGFRLHVWNNMVGWGNEDLPYRLANAGYKVILSPVSNNYFDLAYYKSTEEPGYYWGGFCDVDKPFSFIPFDYYKNTREDAAGNPVAAGVFTGKDEVTAYGQSNILGIQGLIWSETVRSSERLEYMVIPKLLGLAERAWAPDPDWARESERVKLEASYRNAWSVFANTVGKRQLPMLSHIHGGYAFRIPAPGVVQLEGRVWANTQFPGMVLRYTTDGTLPGPKAKIYTTPIAEKATIKIRCFDSSGRGGRIVTIQNN